MNQSKRRPSIVLPAKPGTSGPVTVKLTTPAGQTVTRSDLITRYVPQVSFTATTEVTATASGFIRLADVDGDGALDLLMPGASLIQLAPGNGNGTFKTLLTTPTGTSRFSIEEIVVGDLNKDQKLDLVCVNDDQLSIQLGKGGFTFEPAVVSADTAAPSSVALADLNGN